MLTPSSFASPTITACTQYVPSSSIIKMPPIPLPAHSHNSNNLANMPATLAPSKVQIHEWFIEPIPTPHHLQHSTLKVRLWGLTTPPHPKGKWWRSSSVQRRLSPTLLKTRFGTEVKLVGAICKQHAVKMRMSATTIDTFVHGFPTTWKQNLAKSFTPTPVQSAERPFTPAVKERDNISDHPRRSSRYLVRQRSVSFLNKDEETAFDEPIPDNLEPSKAVTPTPRTSTEAVKFADAETRCTTRAAAAKASDQLPTQPSSPENGWLPSRSNEQPVVQATSTSRPSPQKRKSTRQTEVTESRVRKGKAHLKLQSTAVRKPGKRASRARPSDSPSVPDVKSPVSTRKHDISASKPSLPPPTPAPISKRTRGPKTKSNCRSTLTTSTTREHDSAAPLSPLPKIRKTTIKGTRSTRSRSGPQHSASSATTTKATSLAARLRSAQEVKKARRSRRVVFAEVREGALASAADGAVPETPIANRQQTKAVMSTAAIVANAVAGEKGEWTSRQLKAYERARNSVAADEKDYWERIAAGVEGRNAEECRKLWESTWTSPRVGTEKRKNMRIEGTPEMIAGLQRARKTARGRETAKFKTRVRLLAEKVARGLEDDALEPLVLEGEGVRTPKSVEGVEAGTPGTEVREKRRGLEEAGKMETPEILKRGRSVGFREMDKYVGGFWRRVGKEKSGKEMEKREAGNATERDKDLVLMEPTEMALSIDPMEREGSDFSDEEPFF